MERTSERRRSGLTIITAIMKKIIIIVIYAKIRLRIFRNFLFSYWLINLIPK